MKHILLTCVAIAAGFLLLPHTAGAHHGWTEFDSTREVTLEGTVTDFHFVYPHCVVEFDVKDQKGQVRNWQGEFSNPVQLARRGWTAASLEEGTKVTMGNPARKDARALHVTRVRLATGQALAIEEGR